WITPKSKMTFYYPNLEICTVGSRSLTVSKDNCWATLHCHPPIETDVRNHKDLGRIAQCRLLDVSSKQGTASALQCSPYQTSSVKVLGHKIDGVFGNRCTWHKECRQLDPQQEHR